MRPSPPQTVRPTLHLMSIVLTRALLWPHVLARPTHSNFVWCMCKCVIMKEAANALNDSCVQTLTNHPSRSTSSVMQDSDEDDDAYDAGQRNMAAISPQPTEIDLELSQAVR